MFGIKKQDFYATAEQDRWDRKFNERMLNVNICAGIWFAIFLVPAVGILITKVLEISSGDLSGYDAIRKELVKTSGAIIYGSLIMTFIGLLLSIPLIRYFKRSRLALGQRPADLEYKLSAESYMRRVIKPIPVTVSPQNSTVWIFRVPGLYSGDNTYNFRVEQLVHKQRFYDPEYYYRITERDNKFAMSITIDGNNFYGMGDSQTISYISTYISCALEDNTDYFKEPAMELTYDI